MEEPKDPFPDAPDRRERMLDVGEIAQHALTEKPDSIPSIHMVTNSHL